MKKLIFILIFPIFLFAKIKIVTYFPLETEFIKKIAKNQVEVSEITHRYSNKFTEIPSSELRKLSNSNLFFHLGLNIETTYAELLKKNNRDLKVIDLSKDIEKINANPYIWTDPFAIKDVARNILDTLIEFDSGNSKFYKKNYNDFLSEIDEIFLKILQNLNKSNINSFYAIEDYWDYFANRFRLEIIKKDKKIFTTLELMDLSKTYEESSSNKLLYCYSKDEEFANILAKNLKAEAIENDIFSGDWQTNLLNLTSSIVR